MRKITQFHDTDKPDPKNLLLAVDVSSRSLDLYSRYRLDGIEYEVAESFQNDLTTISDRLDEYAKQARGLGYNGNGSAGERLTKTPPPASSTNTSSMAEEGANEAITTIQEAFLKSAWELRSVRRLSANAHALETWKPTS